MRFLSLTQHYRTKDEVQEYKDIDPINKVKDVILKKKYASKKQIEEIWGFCEKMMWLVRRVLP